MMPRIQKSNTGWHSFKVRVLECKGDVFYTEGVNTGSIFYIEGGVCLERSAGVGVRGGHDSGIYETFD